MTRQPRDPWRRRYYARINRPYAGCGCLYPIIIIVVVYLVIALLFSLTPFGM